MAENASHGPGKTPDGGTATRQRFQEGISGISRTEVSPYPGRKTIGAHGDHMPHDGVLLADHQRGAPPAIEGGKEEMAAQAHPDHGPHHHRYREPERPNTSRIRPHRG